MHTLIRNTVASLLLIPLPVLADSLPAEDEALELEPMVVVASKISRPLSEVAGQVTVIDADQIGDQLIESLDDLLRLEPGLATETAGTRFGVTGVNIRGIGGNRVAIEVDGVPLRNRFAVGSYSNGGRNLVDTELIRRVEILHGPASSLYGSDALGGVMAISTWDPNQLLAKGDGRYWRSLRSAYRSVDDSRATGLVFAAGGDRHGAMIQTSRRDGQQSDHAAFSNSTEDHLNWNSQDTLFRYTYETAGQQRLRMSWANYQREQVSDVRSILGFARFRSTTDLKGHDEDEVSRWVLDYDFSSNALEHGIFRVFTSRSETRQLTLEERASARVPARYQRYFEYQNDMDGLELAGFKRLAWGGSDHRLGAGIEWLQTRSEELRDGQQQNLSDGSISKTVLGELLPVRDFPNATVRELGLFVQDEISFGGAWTLIPAMRWDRYELNPRPDALYLEDFPDTEIVRVKAQQWTSRLGVVRQLPGGWSLYGQYAEGFRAPPHEDANIGFHIELFRYRAIPNPELRSESSSGFELGIRHHAAGRSFSAALFDTDYRDFIDSRAPLGVDEASGYLLFQSRNIHSANIRGVDLRWHESLGHWREAWAAWSADLALYWSQGRDLDNGQPLNSISPPQAVLGLAWQPSEQWSAQLNATVTRSQKRIDESAGARFATPGYGVLDLSLGYQAANRLEFHLAIRNLADRRYWRWSDVANLAVNDPMLPLLSQPGRNISLSAKWAW